MFLKHCSTWNTKCKNVCQMHKCILLNFLLRFHNTDIPACSCSKAPWSGVEGKRRRVWHFRLWRCPGLSALRCALQNPHTTTGPHGYPQPPHEWPQPCYHHHHHEWSAAGKYGHLVQHGVSTYAVCEWKHSGGPAGDRLLQHHPSTSKLAERACNTDKLVTIFTAQLNLYDSKQPFISIH